MTGEQASNSGMTPKKQEEFDFFYKMYIEDGETPSQAHERAMAFVNRDFYDGIPQEEWGGLK